MKKTIAALFGCSVIFAAYTQSATAQTFSFGDATAGWANACRSDVAKYCKVIKSNGNELVLCLTNNASPGCRAATNKFIENRNARLLSQREAPKHCKADAKRLCSNFKEGQGRILKCLLQNSHFRQATKNCKGWLNSAGWLDKITN